MGGKTEADASDSKGFAAGEPSWTRLGRQVSSFLREGLPFKVRELELRFGLGDRYLLDRRRVGEVAEVGMCAFVCAREARSGAVRHC